jgi:1-deoxy-D-xylulose-5-phosphate reductoisomerase
VTGVVVLGATGSIGTQALEVADRLGMMVRAVAARRPSTALVSIAEERPGVAVAVADPGESRADLAAALGSRVSFGDEAVAALASLPDVVVVNGIVGAAGLAPSVAALRAGNRLALANKESLVAGGGVVIDARDAGGGELVPVDSEHSAIWQVLVGEDVDRVRRIVLTASGGPFRGLSREELAGVTPQQALAHPTWSMGPRITVDSATLMNKAFEVIEAHHLFGVTYDAIDVVVHPQSIVHSMVEFVDGAVTAELGIPDMRVPIQYALTYPARRPAPVPPLDLSATVLSFEPPDGAVFRCLELGYEAGRRGGSAPAVLNAADEVAVAAFLAGRIGFLDIATVVEQTLESVPWCRPATVAEVLDVDEAARAVAAGVVEARA